MCYKIYQYNISCYIYKSYISPDEGRTKHMSVNTYNIYIYIYIYIHMYIYIYIYMYISRNPKVLMRF